nr:uncharacterized protein LOC113724110 [Coffea arabica]
MKNRCKVLELIHCSIGTDEKQCTSTWRAYKYSLLATFTNDTTDFKQQFGLGKMESKAIHCFLILLIISSICDASRLSQLNKTPLKSIESKDGDVIDCVHIYHQPAFDHPLLKDHVIQMRPKHQPEGLLAENRQLNRRKSITQLWQSSGSCPEETIPIRRTKQVDASGASFIPSINLHNKGANTELIGQAPTLQFVAALVGDDQYHGATANINVWEPQVQQSSDFSSSQLSFTAGSDVSNFDSIQAGWHIHNSQTIGCFNLLCSGFVQTSNEIALGAAISPLSTFHGAQFGVDVLIFKDPSQDVWWLHYEGTPIGYWPSKLFADLANTASVITWGGSVLSSESDGQQTTTQMGSGHFPEEGFGGASYMRDLYLVDESLKLKPLGNPTTSAKQPNCYNITLGRNEGGGDFIFYGGPGRNPNCP